MKSIIGFFLLVFPFFAFAQSTEYQTITDNHEVIWDIEWFGEDTLIFTELKGKVKMVDLNTQEVFELLTLQNVAAENQAGLMGMQLAPDFSSSNKVYLAYTIYDEDFNIYKRVSTFSYNPQTAKLESEEILVDSILSKNANLGGRLLIDNGFIYLTSGDNQNENLAQDLQSTAGKILFYQLDGTPGNGTDAIYSFGHRNPQGICKTPNGNLIISEHGSFNDDEINLLEQSRNFGWPLVSGMKEQGNEALYNQHNIKEPLTAFTPTIAPSGIAFYENGNFPDMDNSLLVATLKDQAVHVLTLNATQDSIVSQKRIDLSGIGRIRDILVSPSGRIFAVTSNKDVYGEPKPNDDRIVELLEGVFSSTKELEYQRTALRVFGNRVYNISSNIQNISVFDLGGNLVKQFQLNQGGNFSFDGFSMGIYLLKTSDGLIKPQKIFVH